MAYVTWRYLNHLKWNSFQCLEIDFCLAQKTEPKAWRIDWFWFMDPCFDLYILEKIYFRRKRFKRTFFCRVTKNESNEIIIFWIESIISKRAPEITWKT